MLGPLVLLLSTALVAGDDGFALHMLTDTKAQCLDGSMGGYYKREGDASTWLIEMEGGGWCSSSADCESRAKTAIGSSKGWPARGCPGMDGGSNGMLSSNCAVNSHFCTATAVHMNYCDGASFAASNGQTGSLFYSGAFIFNATVAELLAQGMGSAKEVILKGCSAGGLAVYLHCDLFAAMLKEAGSSARVVCMPDAGFFRLNVDTVAGVPLYTTQQQWVYSAQGVVQMDSGCVAAHAASNDTWKCFFAEENLPYITTPLFATQDMVDSWQMSNILKLPCNPTAASGATVCNSTYLADMQAFRDDMLAKLQPLASNPANGGFLSACVQHCHQNIDAVWTQEMVQNQSVTETFWAWWSGASPGVKTLVIDGDFKSNAHCFGVPYCK